MSLDQSVAARDQMRSLSDEIGSSQSMHRLKEFGYGIQDLAQDSQKLSRATFGELHSVSKGLIKVEANRLEGIRYFLDSEKVLHLQTTIEMEPNNKGAPFHSKDMLLNMLEATVESVKCFSFLTGGYAIAYVAESNQVKIFKDAKLTDSLFLENQATSPALYTKSCIYYNFERNKRSFIAIRSTPTNSGVLEVVSVDFSKEGKVAKIEQITPVPRDGHLSSLFRLESIKLVVWISYELTPHHNIHKTKLHTFSAHKKIIKEMELCTFFGLGGAAEIIKVEKVLQLNHSLQAENAPVTLCLAGQITHFSDSNSKLNQAFLLQISLSSSGAVRNVKKQIFEKYGSIVDLIQTEDSLICLTDRNIACLIKESQDGHGFRLQPVRGEMPSESDPTGKQTLERCCLGTDGADFGIYRYDPR